MTLKKLVKLLENYGLKVIDCIYEKTVFKLKAILDGIRVKLNIAQKQEKWLVNIELRTFLIDTIEEIPKFIVNYIRTNKILLEFGG